MTGGQGKNTAGAREIWHQPSYPTTTSLTIATDNIYVGVTLNKQVKVLYDKNFKDWKKKLKTLSEDRKMIMFINQLEGLI